MKLNTVENKFESLAQSEETALPEPSELIRRAWGETQIKFMKGAISTFLRLTPTGIRRLEAAPKPKLLQERCVVRLPDLENFAHPIDVESWKDRYSNRVSITGIYDGNLKFPKLCCSCLEPATRYELVEVGVRSNNPGRLALYGVDRETAERMFAALREKRFWYAIPYCKEHGLHSGSIEIDMTGLGPKLLFTNKEFAKQFCELNGLKGKWLDRRARIARAVAIWGVLWSQLPAMFAAISIWKSLSGESPFFGQSVAIGLLVPSLFVFAISFFYWIKNRWEKDLQLEPTGQMAGKQT